MKKLHLGLLVAGLMVLLVLWPKGPRGVSTDRPKKPDRSRKAEAPLEENPLLESKRIDPSEKFQAHDSMRASRRTASSGLWNWLSKEKRSASGDSEREAIRATAKYLALEPSSLTAFEAIARQSIQDLDLALAIRQQELLMPIPQGMTRKAQVEMSRQSVARFNDARRRALERMEPYLNQTSIHQEFRGEFDTWAATLSMMGRGVYR